MLKNITDLYLGVKLCREKLRVCIEATVKDRPTMIKGSIYEIRALIEDFRMQTIGDMQMGN